MFGYGTTCPAMSNACLTGLGFLGTVYHNPAGLTGVDAKTVSFSYQSAFFSVHAQGEPTGELKSPDRSGGVTFGAAVPLPLPKPFGERLALGLGMFIPDTSLIRAKIPAPGSPWYPVIGNRSNTLGVHAALGIRVIDSIRIGAGVKVLAKLVGDISVSPNESGTLSSSIRDELLTTASPLLGATFLLGKFWRVALVYRGEEKGAFSLPVAADLGDEFPLEVPDVNIEGLAQYDPRQTALSVGWHPSKLQRMEISLQWRQWSAYPKPLAEATPAAPELPLPNFEDTWSPRVGGETGWLLGKNGSLHVRGGYSFEPSPIPDRGAPPSYFDNHRHILSVGGEWQWKFTKTARLSLQFYAQEHLLQERVQTLVEDEGSNSADISTGGQIHLIGGGLEVQFE